MLRTRLISALVLIPSVLFLTWLGRPYFDALMGVCGGIMAWEWARLRNGRRLPPSGGIGILAVVGSIGAGALAAWWMAVLILAAGAACSIAAAGLARESRIAWIAAGPFYVGLPCLAMLWLRSDPEMGFAMVAWLLVFVWSVDSAAYAAGRSIGGPRLWPTVSPNKTWAGLAGGVLAGAIVAMAFAVWSPGAPIALLGALGAAFAIAEQAGDLIESSVKRHFGVKDTGALIPGHGGLLDRVDGLMLVALAAAALRALGQAYLPAP